MNNICEVCQTYIQVMCFKGTGACSELCRKEFDGRRSGDGSPKPNIEGDLAQLEDTHESRGGTKHKLGGPGKSAAA